MAIYTINYTETEDMAMKYIALDVDDWIQNVAHERARVAMDEIIKIAVDKFLETGQQIPSSREEIVMAAFANGWVKTVEETNQEKLINT